MLQRIINSLYRLPKSRLKNINRFGGFINYQKILLKEAQMQKASRLIPPMKCYADGLKIYFLTGQKYIHQTLFCILSITKCTDEFFNFILVDDGSFDTSLINRIKTQLPGSKIVTAEDILKNLQKYLPEYLYPSLHDKRRVYPHIKKLTDIHTIPDEDWKLVLDSDILFWNPPDELINWLKQPDMPIYMQDFKDSYGYSRKLMEELCNASIPDKLNVGVIGLNSGDIDFKSIECWVKNLERMEGTSYFLEQGLTAMIINNGLSHVLPDSYYKINPSFEDLTSKKHALHHYVDLSKEIYFKYAWRQVY